MHQFSGTQLGNASVLNVSKGTYLRNFDLFRLWMAKKHRQNRRNYPTFKTLVKNFDFNELTWIFREYITWRFNTTENIGDTLRGEFTGILYGCRMHGLYITGDWFPGVNSLFKGVSRLFMKGSFVYVCGCVRLLCKAV